MLTKSTKKEQTAVIREVKIQSWVKSSKKSGYYPFKDEAQTALCKDPVRTAL
jgi:hypothetical protein